MKLYRVSYKMWISSLYGMTCRVLDELVVAPNEEEAIHILSNSLGRVGSNTEDYRALEISEVMGYKIELTCR